MTFSLLGIVVEAITVVMVAIGLPGLFGLMTVESFGIPPIPSEVILPFAGFLVAEGTFSLEGALAACLLGGLVGAFAAYAVGRWWRHRIVGIGLGPFRLEPRHLERMDTWFRQHGEATVALARIVPIVRSYISYPAGTAEMPPARFGAYTLLGMTPYAVGLLYAGMLLRSRWSSLEPLFRWFDYAGAAIVLGLLVYVVLVLRGKLLPGWPPRRPPTRAGEVPPS